MTEEDTMNAIDICICGVDTNEFTHAAHYDRPDGSLIVAWSCSASCEAAIESLRDATGRLTVNAVAMGRQVFEDARAKLKAREDEAFRRMTGGQP